MSDNIPFDIQMEIIKKVYDVRSLIRFRQAQEIIEELVKPLDESEDYIKWQRLRELAMLNSNFRDESPGPSGSVGFQPAIDAIELYGIRYCWTLIYRPAFNDQSLVGLCKYRVTCTLTERLSKVTAKQPGYKPAQSAQLHRASLF
ncbi:KH domain-containing protein [Tanacetum coccineum]